MTFLITLLFIYTLFHVLSDYKKVRRKFQEFRSQQRR